MPVQINSSRHHNIKRKARPDSHLHWYIHHHHHHDLDKLYRSIISVVGLFGVFLHLSQPQLSQLLFSTTVQEQTSSCDGASAENGTDNDAGQGAALEARSPAARGGGRLGVTGGLVLFSGKLLVVLTRLRGVEARDTQLEVDLVDVGDVGTGIECLVVGGVPVGLVDDLESRVGTCGDPGGGVRNRYAGVARV